ncbi:hypothetical protein CAJAP_03483 [Camponotus japonicus]
METYGKRKKKDTSCVSNRHLKRLAAQESEIISDILLCSDESSSSCVNMNNECTTDLNNDCTTNSKIDIEQNTDSNENNEIFVYCENDNTLRQSDEYNISNSEESPVNFSYNEPNDITFEITSSNLQHNLATWA